MPKKPPFLRILLVDDDDGVFKQLHFSMRRHPPAEVELVYAKEMEQALELIPKAQPSVILLDLNLSVAWTWERTLGMIQPMEKLGNCPVIAFSGLDPERAWPAAIAAGAFNFFCKEEALDPGFRSQILADITTALFLYRRLNPVTNDAAER